METAVDTMKYIGTALKVNHVSRLGTFEDIAVDLY